MEKDIEQLIKIEFKNRELNVTPHLFNNLLDKMEVKKSLKRYLNYKYLSIAASVIFVVFIAGVQWFKPHKSIKESVTEIKTHIPLVIENYKSKNTINQKINGAPQFIVESKKPKKINKNLVLNPILDKMKLDNSIQDLKISLKKPHFKYSEKSLIVTDLELESLLTTASSHLKKLSGDSLKVNAHQLLIELEIEINKPLPEKVILTLKSGSKTIKNIFNPKDN